jgi:hypothetical protein
MHRTYAVATLIATLGSAGCASAGTAGAGAQTAARAADASASPCRVVGPSQVVASGDFVPAGVEAGIEDGRLTLRYAHSKTECVEASVLPSGRVVRTHPSERCPGTGQDMVATSDGETLLAREALDDSRTPHVELGVVVYDTPHAFFGFALGAKHGLVETSFTPPERTGGERSPALAGFSGERFLLTWVDGNAEGHALRGQAVAGWGSPVGQVLDLSPADVSVIGHPSVALGPDGRGIVAFLASSEVGFDVRATPVACGD